LTNPRALKTGEAAKRTRKTPQKKLDLSDFSDENKEHQQK